MSECATGTTNAMEQPRTGLRRSTVHLTGKPIATLCLEDTCKIFSSHLLLKASNPQTLPAAWSSRVLTQACSVLIFFEIRKKLSYNLSIWPPTSLRSRLVSQHYHCVRCVSLSGVRMHQFDEEERVMSKATMPPRSFRFRKPSRTGRDLCCLVIFPSIDSSSTQMLKLSAMHWRTAKNFPRPNSAPAEGGACPSEKRSVKVPIFTARAVTQRAYWVSSENVHKTNASIVILLRAILPIDPRCSAALAQGAGWGKIN